MVSKYVTLATDPATGDLLLRSGLAGLVLARGGNKIVQNIKERLKVFLGEWFLNLADGVSYYRDFLIKGASIPVIKSVIRERITSTSGVIEVLSVDVSFDRPKRTMNIKFRARIAEATDDGLFVVSTSVSYLLTPGGDILTFGGDTLTL